MFERRTDERAAAEPAESEASEASGEAGREEGARRVASADVRAGFDFARAWRVAACLLLAAAAVLLYLRHTDAALFTTALGVSAWFLNVRTNLKRKHDLVKDGGRNWRPRRDVEGRDVQERDVEGRDSEE